LLGDKNIRFWRDKKLGGADLFDQTIILERRLICELTMRNSSTAIARRSAV
jgi:hypothetical protein